MSGDAETATRLNLPRMRDRLRQIVEEIEQAIDGPSGSAKQSPARKRTGEQKKGKKKDYVVDAVTKAVIKTPRATECTRSLRQLGMISRTA